MEGFNNFILLTYELTTKEAPIRVVQIRGFQPTTSSDVVRMFIENKLSGKIPETFDYNKENGFATVKFQDSKDATELLQNDHLQLEDVKLTLTPMNDFYDGIDLTTCQSQAIRVAGISCETTENCMLTFFKKAGGDIEHHEYDSLEGVAVITYADANSVRKVLAMQRHVIEKNQVTVTALKPHQWLPYINGPFEENAVLLSNFSPKCTRRQLEEFFSTQNGCGKIENVTYSPKPGVAVLQFAQPPDHTHLRQVCIKKSLLGSMMNVQKIAQTRTIQVHNIGELTEDALRVYFENRRSGGGEVTRIYICPENSHALVEFAEYKTVRNVLAKDGHRLQKRQLLVAIYHNSLGLLPPNHDSTKPGCWIPQSTTVTGLNRRLMMFLEGSPACRQHVQREMESSFAVVEWQGCRNEASTDILLRCTISNSIENAYETAKNWKQTATDVFLQIVGNDFAVEHIAILESTWLKYCERIVYVEELDRDEVLVERTPDDNTVHVTGLKREVGPLSTCLKAELIYVQNKIARAAKEITKTRSGFRLPFLWMLNAKEFVSKQRKQSQVEVSIDETRYEVQLTGLPEDVDIALIEMYNDINNRMIHTGMKIPHSLVKLLKHVEIKKYMSKKFQSKEIVAVYDVITDSQLDVYALVEAHMDIAINMIRSEIDEQTIDDPPATRMIASEWTELDTELQSLYAGLLNVTVDPRRITVLGPTYAVRNAVTEIDMYLRVGAMTVERINLECGIVEYMERNMEKDIGNITHNENVEITRTVGELCGFVVRGYADLVKVAASQLTDLAIVVKAEQFIADQPGMATFLTTYIGQRSLSDIENQHRVIIKARRKPTDEEPGISTSAVHVKVDVDGGLSERFHCPTVFNIYATSAEVIDVVRKTLMQMWDDQRDRMVYESDNDQDNIAALTLSQITHIRWLSEELDVKLVIDQSSPRKTICVQGWRVNVAQVKQTISVIFKEIEYTIDVAKQVHWRYAKDDNFVNYSNRINALLEKTLNDKMTYCEWKDDKNVAHIVDFNRMFETTSRRTGDVAVKRELIIDGIELPTNWSPMDGKENCQLELLKPNTPEYRKIKKMFTCTAGNTVAGIHKIERVQNKKLYTQYATSKREIQKQCALQTAVERTLWYGARTSTTDVINNSGFCSVKNDPNATIVVHGLRMSTTAETIEMFFENHDRSGGGPVEHVQLEDGDDVAYVTFKSRKDAKNVLSMKQLCLDAYDLTVASTGIYFSVNSKYAAHRIHCYPDMTGIKRAYQALVLTGDYTSHVRSCTSLPDNPYKQGMVFHSLVDSVATQRLFSIFSDDRAYPNYLITFW